MIVSKHEEWKLLLEKLKAVGSKNVILHEILCGCPEFVAQNRCTEACVRAK